jgi:serine phosphatase RsbU (regulator of sigma subunit)
LALANDSLDFLEGETDQREPAVEPVAIPPTGYEGIVDAPPQIEQIMTCSQGEHGSLLIVDDNEGNRELLSRRLIRQGYTVSVAENGRQALELIQAAQFDLVLLDILMPEMNGYQVLEQLKADEDLRHIPVIVLSALDELDSVVTCIELGADDYLPTPFDPVLLRARISASLEKKRLREQEVFYLQQIAEEKQRSEALIQARLSQALQELQVMHGQIIEKEKLERELQVARRIQHMLLPKQLPSLSGWQVATYYQPARAVGGDFYDFFPLPDGRLGLVIGDATDKGVPAALVMATTRSILRGVAQGQHSPGEVLARVNDLLQPDIPPNMFVTCLYAILDPASGYLHYANSGHDLPYRRHKGGVAELRAVGLPLGMLPGIRYEEKEVTLLADETVLFYSDGLVEAHDPQREMFGFPRLQQLLADCPTHTALIDFLLSELARFTGGDWEQEDDITLVALHRFA